MKTEAPKYPVRDYVLVVKVGDGPISAANEASIEIRGELLEGWTTEMPKLSARVPYGPVRIDWQWILTRQLRRQ